MLFRKRKNTQLIRADAAIVEKVLSSGLFDAEWYMEHYPEINKFKAGALEHFCQYGIFEYRDPGPNFSTSRYLAFSPKSNEITEAPFLHAVSEAETVQGRPAWLADDAGTFAYLLKRSGFYDEAYYVAQNKDVGRSGSDPFDHYIHIGAIELRDPGPEFDSEYYTEICPGYSEFCRTPIEHFLRVGRNSGYVTKGPSKYQRWIDAFDTLTSKDLAGFDSSPRYVDLAPPIYIHVLDLAGCRSISSLVKALHAQVGIAWKALFLRGVGVNDAAWAACVASRDADVRITFVDAAADVTHNLRNDDVVVLCAGACTLRPHTLTIFAEALASDNVDGAYADHDRIDIKGVRTAPVFKPAMSPNFMRGLAYGGPIVALRIDDEIRATLADALGQTTHLERLWSDLLLGIDSKRIAHIPLILYHVIASSGELQNGYLEPGHGPSNPKTSVAHLVDDEGSHPSVGIIVPTRDRSELLKECIDSIRAKTDYPSERFEILVVDNDSEEDATATYFAEISSLTGIKILPYPGPFNFAAICNAGAAETQAEILIFLNNDMTVIQADWMRKLVAYARRPEIGLVGAQLLYPDDTVQHGGVVLGVQGVGAHRLVGVDSKTALAMDATREMTAITGACLAVRREVFEQLGGFDPILTVAFNDAKLCADAFLAGYRNLYIGEPLLYHHESKSRGFDDSWAKRTRNSREAIYVRDRVGRLFQDDPSYNPNLSLQQVGGLAMPPRVVRPWRQDATRPSRVLLLSSVHGLGHGVAMVVAEQAAFLRDRGWEVVVGGPERARDIVYPGCARVGLWNAQAAASYAVAEGIDCIIAHTPPFYSVTRYLGRSPLVYFFDHGEPPPHLFADTETRHLIDWEKRFCAPLAKRVFTISQTIYDQQYRADAIVLRNGNGHLSTWSDDWANQRAALRRKYGFEGRFVVLNVSRFGAGERRYKGIDQYMELAAEAQFAPVQPAGPALFVLAGRGDPVDIAHVRAAGVTVFADVSNEEMAELYAASDLFMSLSRWEGYNLGIGQARAMGLKAVGSDIEAHREFGIETANTTPLLLALLARCYAAWDEGASGRCAVVESWDEPLRRLSETIELDVAADKPRPWFRTVPSR